MSEAPELAATRYWQLMGLRVHEQLGEGSASEALSAWSGALHEIGIATMSFPLRAAPCHEYVACNIPCWHEPMVIVLTTNWKLERSNSVLLHELGHVALRTNSACSQGAFELSNELIESWCNAFAAALLTPR